MRKGRPAGDLHSPAAPTETTSELHPLLVEALTRLTHTLQCHRAISEEFEHDLVVGSLLVLHDAGVPLDEAPMHAWVTARHWSGRAVDRLAVCVHDIATGRRPRAHPVLPRDYLHQLRRRVAAQQKYGQDQR